MMNSNLIKTIGLTISALALASSCSRSVDNQFRLKPVEENLESGHVVTEELVSTETRPVDILWVIDNSVSMRSSQTALKNGLAKFANSYLGKETDIQMGIITTDAYIANPVYAEFLKTPIGGYVAPQKKNPKWGPGAATLTSRTLIKTKDRSKSTLVSQFENAVMVGTQGLPEERGFESILQFFDDNEMASDSKTKLFRPNSHRIVVFLSDEDDQSILPEKNVGKLLYHGMKTTGKLAAELDANLPQHLTTACPEDKLDGQTLAAKSVCTRPGFELPVKNFSDSLERFFAQLDGRSDPSKITVVAITLSDIESIQNRREKVKGEVAHERGVRYAELVSEIGNGSFVQDIGITDYSKVLEKIGLVIMNHSIQRKFKATSQFKLTRAPAQGERFEVVIERQGGARTALTSSQYSVSGNILTLTDEKLISTLKAGDRVTVHYQPATVLPAGQASLLTTQMY